jgi:hypothetical protein
MTQTVNVRLVGVSDPLIIVTFLTLTDDLQRTSQSVTTT